HGGNASRVVRGGLPCCPAQATAVRGSPTVRRSPTTSTPRNHVRAPRGAGTTGRPRSAMNALWAPGLGGDLVSPDPTSQLLRFSARHTPAHRGSQTLSQGNRSPDPLHCECENACATASTAYRIMHASNLSSYRCVSDVLAGD